MKKHTKTPSLKMTKHLLVCAGLVATSELIAISPEPDRGETAMQTNSELYQPVGIHAGSFMLYPVVELGVEYDDNVFKKVNSAALGDSILSVKPSLSVQSGWSRHALNAFISTEIASYGDYSGENFEDFNISTDGRYDVMRDSYISAGLGYSRLHEDRSDPDALADPTQYDYFFSNLGYNHKFNRVSMAAKYNHTSMDYDSTASDRSRSRDELVLRLSYDLRPQFDIFVEGSVNEVRYDQRPTDVTKDRSTDGHRVTAGLSLDLTSVLEGDIYVGELKQNYDGSFFKAVDGSVYGFGLTWYASGLTTINANLDRRPQESSEAAAAGYLTTSSSLKINHELQRNILLSADMGYSINDYPVSIVGAKEQEKMFNLGLGVKYLFNRQFYAKGAYAYNTRNSDVASEEYESNEFKLTLGIQW